MTADIDLDELEQRCDGLADFATWEIRELIALARPKPLPADLASMIETLRESDDAYDFEIADTIERLQRELTHEHALFIETSGEYDTMSDRAEAAEARCAALLKLIERAREELRLIGMKDSGAIYDIGLRIQLSHALSPETGSPREIVTYGGGGGADLAPISAKGDNGSPETGSAP